MNIRTTFAAGRLTVYLLGELDHHEARCTTRAIDDLLDEYLPRDCVLDLNGLSFMDSSGIAVVMRAQKRMRALDGGAVLRGVPPQAKKVFAAAGIFRLIPLEEGESSDESKTE